ncbi:MAG: CDP-diacylglycerol--glycerol-3-phosphate 3-phosphatidyltransferase [Gammaproteobacteria bacterium]|nr:CDP-diacylglycerol--glycerol-3-phosphate 3-phosphatidyltransferase [Gammaproteobacteria bacterium]
MNAANFMTFLRILLIPFFIAVYYADFTGHYLVSSLIFIIACVTDWLDGYLARKLDQCTPFGAFLDPVADKILITVALVMLAANYASPWFVIPAAIMVAREILVSALREWMAEQNKRNVVAVGWLGKVKTTVQMIAIIVLLASDPQGSVWFWGLGFVLIYLAAILTLWSMVLYIRSAWSVLGAEIK